MLKALQTRTLLRILKNMPPIYMMVLDGVTEEALRAMMEDDDDTRSTRVTARKHLNLISKCKFDGFKKKKYSKSLPVCVNLPIFAKVNS